MFTASVTIGSPSLIVSKIQKHSKPGNCPTWNCAVILEIVTSVLPKGSVGNKLTGTETTGPPGRDRALQTTLGMTHHYDLTCLWKKAFYLPGTHRRPTARGGGLCRKPTGGVMEVLTMTVASGRRRADRYKGYQEVECQAAWIVLLHVFFDPFHGLGDAAQGLGGTSTARLLLLAF